MIQFSFAANLFGDGAFIALYTIGRLLGGASREVNIGQAIPLFAVLYLIAGLLILAAVVALVGMMFSRKAMYRGIPHIPASVYAYCALTA